MSASRLQALYSPAAVARFVLTAVIGIAIDLATKVWAFKTLAVEMVQVAPGRWEVTSSQTYPFIPGFLHFHVTVNHGAVFGIGQGKIWLFLLVSVFAIVFLSYLFAVSRRRQWFYQLVLGMLLAGVLGNMYDRIVHGHVRDMIHALPRWDVFPWIFNVADALLCVGVALMLAYTLLVKDKPDPAPKAEPVASQ
jgi:signal peptidase II